MHLSKLKDIKLFVIVFFLNIIVGFLLLYLVNLLPTSKMAEHVRESNTAVGAEGEYWQIVMGGNTNYLDNFTDSIMLLSAGYSGDESALDKTINVYRGYKKGATTKGESVEVCGTLTEAEEDVQTYDWYWCGFLVLLKPLLLFLNMMEIRKLNAIIVMAEIIIIGILLERRKKTSYLIPFALLLAFWNISAIIMCLQLSSVFHLTMIACICILCSRTENLSKVMVFFMGLGMITSYMDFLTYPIITLVIPMCMWVILADNINPLKKCICTVSSSAMWCVGYIGMWAGKWILSSLIMRKDYIANAIEKLTLRTGSVLGETKITSKDVIEMEKVYLTEGHILHYLLIFIAICMVGVVISRIWKDSQKLATSFLLLMLSLYPTIWFMLSKNHSVQHQFLTFRTLGGIIFALGSMLIPLIDMEKIKYKIFGDKEREEKSDE